ncbi:hypothetical protein BDZ85DRAFT_286102 [Elsinoe ampelina]|uniref:Major facilitator superfamily domain-containing protein n=1 Tax=Elsinoe ampelina TaxID=302913 RepID=A0A6A6FZ98_9PEZI|nr:hypothetical protein BDZ85DRAFT_286102 [Elsinoe ampelina]
MTSNERRHDSRRTSALFHNGREQRLEHIRPSKLILKRPATRLPWLDGGASSRSIPGQFGTELSDLTESNAYPSGTSSSPNLLDRSPVPKPRLSIGSLPDVPGSFTRKGGEYTPSTYSGKHRIDKDTDSQHSLSKKDAASYEKLVDRPFTLLDRAEAPAIPPRTSSSTHDVPETGDIGLSAIPRTRSFDGNLSSDAPSVKKPSQQHHRRHAPSTVSQLAVPRAPTTLQPVSMRDTMSNLRSLMSEAMKVAEQAERQNRTEDMSAIFREASVAMRNASQVSGQMRSPLALSDIELAPTSEEYTADSSSDIGSESSAWDSPRRKHMSNETMPTEYSASVPSVGSPRVSSPFADPSKRPSTSLGSQLKIPTIADQVSEGEISPGTVPEKSKSTQLGLPDALQRLHQPPSADSIIIDFAYVERQIGAPSGNLSPVIKSRPHHRNKSLRPSVPERDMDVNPEDVTQVPIRPKTSEEPVPALTSILPEPISEPRVISGSGPKRRKPRKGSTRRSPYYEVPDQAPVERVPTNRETVIIPVPVPEAQVPPQQVVNITVGGGDPGDNDNGTLRKRITAIIACINTALIGLIAGIYAGEVPKIQYQLADMNHRVILGNVFFYIGLGISTLIAWPLPLLHGRKPYILVALALTLPLQFPQAISVSQFRSPDRRWYVALLLPRAVSGLVLGFANVNFLATLLDLFGASLQSHHPHQEIVIYDDIRRQGGGVGQWLGLWSWCFVGSLAVGFLIGAVITARLPPAWGFYFVVILLAVFLLMNIVAPETRRSPHRRSILHYFDEEDNLQRKIARGEIKLHLAQDGPKYWWEEVWAGLRLMLYMVSQAGFAILALYLAWIYALVVLVTLLLSALLSTNYLWRPQYVGLGVFALAVGALLAVPLTRANMLSRDRVEPVRTDSMTFQPRVTWSSHLVRRCIFTFALPLAGLAFTLTSPGPSLNWAAPTVMSALVGFLAVLAIAECVGLTMETYDTCDLQPGANSKHRLQSMDSQTRRRRTNYSCFPRVIAGLFASQGLGFFLAAAATGVSGRITRALGAQAAVGVVAGILLFLTILLSLILWRFRTVQVIPNHAFGTRKGTKEWTADDDDKFWKPVIVGNPSGKVRRMNLLETGKWSRWTEIRRMNKLVKPGTWEVQYGKK